MTLLVLRDKIAWSRCCISHCFTWTKDFRFHVVERILLMGYEGCHCTCYMRGYFQTQHPRISRNFTSLLTLLPPNLEMCPPNPESPSALEQVTPSINLLTYLPLGVWKAHIANTGFHVAQLERWGSSYREGWEQGPVSCGCHCAEWWDPAWAKCLVI